VQMLEKKGIGRPSTFSSLIDKIQERGYAKVQDVRGKSIECVEYILQEDKKIEKKTEVREIGGEHRKLVILPLGIIVIEFLMEHFAPLFDYEFTEQMEFQLDEIATDGMVWHELCYKCWHEVSNQLQELKTRGIVKEEFRIDDNHTYIIGKFGPVIKCVVSNPIHKSIEHVDEDLPVDDEIDLDDAGDDAGDGGGGKQVVIFKPVRKDLDYSKILRGEYTLEYMIGSENTVVGDDTATTNNTSGLSVGRCLGQYQGNSIYIKSGKYGPYVSWGSQNLSLRALLGTYSSKNNKFARKETKQSKSEFDLTLQDVIEFIRGQKSNNTNEDDSDAAVNNDSAPGCAAAPPTTAQSQIVRVIDDNSSIRNGRFGPYIFYKTPKMSKPDFIPLKGFAQKNGDYAKCDIAILKEWITSSSSTKKTNK